MPRPCTSCARGSIAHEAKLAPDKAASFASLLSSAYVASTAVRKPWPLATGGIRAGSMPSRAPRRRNAQYEAPPDTKTEIPFLNDIDSLEARIEPLMSMRVRSKRTASCLKKSSAMRGRWVRITFGGEALRTEGRSPSCDAHGIDQAHRAAPSVMLARLTR